MLPALATKKEKVIGCHRDETVEEIRGRDMRRTLHNRLRNQELDNNIVSEDDSDCQL